MIGGYLLGSDTEQISFESSGATYSRAGATHAVDLDDPANVHTANLGYAICGTPVRIWRDEPFDPTAHEAHDRCIELAASTSTPSH